MTGSEVPEPWASAMTAARLVDPRTDAPSMSALAAAMDTHTSTVSAMIHGRRKTSSRLIARAAVALRMEDRLEEVFGWVGVARSEREPFKPHPDSDLLEADERKTINELIALLVRGRRQQQDLPLDVRRRLREARKDLVDVEPTEETLHDPVRLDRWLTDAAAHEDPGDPPGAPEE